MLNQWCGQGRLVRDVDLKHTAGNIPVATFTIATDRDYKPKDGDRTADFIDAVAWRGTAEFIAKYFHKGDMIIINGRIQTRTYETDEGKKRKVTEILCDNVNFGGSRRQEGQAGNGQAQEAQPQDTGIISDQQWEQGSYDRDGFMQLPEGFEPELDFV